MLPFSTTSRALQISTLLFIVRCMNACKVAVRRGAARLGSFVVAVAATVCAMQYSRCRNFDLSNRLQLQSKAINAISQDVKGQATKGDTRHSEVLRNTASRDQVASLEARLQRIESALQSIQRDLEGKDYSGRFNQLHDTLRSSHLSLTENLHGHLLSGKFHYKAS